MHYIAYVTMHLLSSYIYHFNISSLENHCNSGVFGFQGCIISILPHNIIVYLNIMNAEYQQMQCLHLKLLNSN